MSVRVSGTEGYAEQADALVERYESVSFADVHRQFLHLIPTVPSRVLDIGSGTGRDAAGFATLGHDVVAVEPTDELRQRAVALHPSNRIEWLDDSLPNLTDSWGAARASTSSCSRLFGCISINSNVGTPCRTSRALCEGAG